MSSCGNPSAETEALMPRRLKFDKGKNCVKCKSTTGNIVIRHAVYCKECFFSSTITKFRRTLGPSVNPPVDGKRRRSHQATGNLLLAFSGGLGSTVLLDLVSRCYFRSADAGDEQPHGGTNHPRNGGVWSKVTVCYVEVCNAFPGMIDRVDEVRAVVEQYEGFEFMPLRIENAFDSSWWEVVGGRPKQLDLCVDVNSDDLFLSSMATSSSPVASLRSYFASLPTHTAVSGTVQNLIRLLLLYTASSTMSSHLLLGTSLTSLSISLISSVSQGGGFAVREEAEEEWIPGSDIDSKSNVALGVDQGQQNVRVVRPLKDVGIKECAMWAWWSDLTIVGRQSLPGAKQGITGLTKDFIMGLERDYPSTVSTITRTCGKLTPKEGVAGICPLCNRPVQQGVQEWKSRISIRSFAELHADYADSNQESVLDAHDNSDLSPSKSRPLAPHLCYACHTTLTSRSSRGTTSTRKATDTTSTVALPVWVGSHALDDCAELEDRGCASRHKVDNINGGRKPMRETEMKNVIANFLLEDDCSPASS